MRLLILSFILPVVSTVGAAQSTSVANRGSAGVFAQMDGKTPKYATLPNGFAVTIRDPIATRVDLVLNNAAIAHARTKLSLRTIDGLPAIRIHEAGSIPVRTSARARAVGTTAASSGAGATLRPHTWLARFIGHAGARVRVQMRFRSTLAGKNLASPTPTNIIGRARVDVGDDKKIDFDKALDGKRYLDDYVTTLDASGKIDIEIQTAALLTSTANTAAAYSMTFDISIEPVRGTLSSMSPYGPPCGADVFGISWLTGATRHARTILEGAIPSSPALLIVGSGRVDMPLPGVTCNLLTIPLALIPAKTSAAGRLISDFPPVPAGLRFDLDFQYAVNDSGTLNLSKGLGFRVFLDSPEPYQHFDVNHILATGQSLAIGGFGAPVLSKTQPYKNTMFGNGILGYGQGKANQLKPLVEEFWETMSSGMAAMASQQYLTPYDKTGSTPKNTHDILVSVHAQPGLPYLLLKKGTQPFATGMNQFRLAQFIANSQRKSYVVRCVTNVHGETDHTFYNAEYAKNLVEWQADYETEIQSRGQTEPVPMLQSQMSSFTRYGSETSIIPEQQLAVSVANPRKLPLVCPKYYFDYFDGVHLTSKSYREMGEYYGKVYNRIILEGGTWEPLRPLVLRRRGAVITIRFHVPEPPLVFDTTLVSDPGNLGFEYSDDSGTPPKIKSVRLLDEDTVEIVLATVPILGAKSFVAYAFTGKKFARGGPRTGARGNLRDSDRTPSNHNIPLYNWAVQFRYPVN